MHHGEGCGDKVNIKMQWHIVGFKMISFQRISIRHFRNAGKILDLEGIVGWD